MLLCTPTNQDGSGFLELCWWSVRSMKVIPGTILKIFLNPQAGTSLAIISPFKAHLRS